MAAKEKSKRSTVRKRTKSAKTPVAVPARRITEGRRALIAELASLLAEIAPATSRGEKSFCVRNLAHKKGHKKLWRDKANKRKSITHYLEGVFRQYANTPKKVVLEIVSGGVVWKAKQGVAVGRDHLDAIDKALLGLGINVNQGVGEGRIA